MSAHSDASDSHDASSEQLAATGAPDNVLGRALGLVAVALPAGLLATLSTRRQRVSTDH